MIDELYIKNLISDIYNTKHYTIIDAYFFGLSPLKKFENNTEVKNLVKQFIRDKFRWIERKKDSNSPYQIKFLME